jgi:hypothetical protein
MTHRGIEREGAPTGGSPMGMFIDRAETPGGLFAELEGLDLEHERHAWPGENLEREVGQDEPPLVATAWPVFEELEIEDVVRLA